MWLILLWKTLNAMSIQRTLEIIPAVNTQPLSRILNLTRVPQLPTEILTHCLLVLVNYFLALKKAMRFSTWLMSQSPV
jgi:hypothetical protein